jgi:DNA-3-methyladenine glycosylase II
MGRRVPWSAEAYAALCKDRVLGRYVRGIGEVKITVPRDPFVALVRSVVSQQLSGRAASAIYERLTIALGAEGATSRTLARAREHDLRAAGLSAGKSRTLRLLAAAVEEKCLHFGRMRRWSDERIVEELTRFPGIGKWTAEMFLIFALGRQDVMSGSDLGLRKGLAKVYRLEGLPKPKECELLFSRWRPYRSAACWYLWRLE